MDIVGPLTRLELMRTVARAICASYGPRPDCLCGGVLSRCHAVTLYQRETVAAVLALARAGALLPPKD